MQNDHDRSSLTYRTVLSLLAILWLAACGDPTIVDAPTNDISTDVFQGCKTNLDCENRTANGLCEEWLCNLSTGLCETQAVAYGTPCGKPNDCILGICIDGECNTENLFNCDDGNPCTDDECGPDGQCQNTPNQASCIPDHPCGTSGQCKNGVCFLSDYNCPSCSQDSDCLSLSADDQCAGQFVCNPTTQQCERLAGSKTVCTTNNPCMSAACDPDTGACIETPRPDGWACQDGDVCTLENRCVSGECSAANTLACPDEGSDCALTSCEPTTGCVTTPKGQVPCDDGSGCSGNDTCQDGLCIGETSDICECANDSDCSPYDDDDLCNGTLRCTEGVCAIDPASIVQCLQPAVGCQLAYCVPQTGECVIQDATNTGCSDGNMCTQDDQCIDGVCTGTPFACDDNNTCTTDSCLPTTGCVFELLDGCGPNCNEAAGKLCDPGTSQNCGTGGTQECTNNCQWGPCSVQGACTAGESQTCGQCGTQTCGTNNEWGLCQNEGVCTPGATQSCSNGGTQTCTVGCTWGPCQGSGVCETGATKPCGQCGTQSCNANNQWGACLNEGPCSNGQTKPCGNGGTQTCSSNCTWGTCQGEGVCAVGATQPCAKCGTKSCGSNNQWGACLNQGVCSQGQTKPCGNGGTQTCLNNCTWSACQGEGVCAVGATQPCGNCGIQTCNGNYQWGICKNQGECVPGAVAVGEAAGCDVCSEKVCTNQCTWATQCVLSGNNKCEWKKGTNWQYCDGTTNKWQFCLKPEQSGKGYCDWATCQPKPE